MSHATVRPPMTPSTASQTEPARDGRSAAKAGSRRPSDSLPPQTLVKWLRDMYLIREFENRTAQAYQQAKIGGFCHLYIGQEGAAGGTHKPREPHDPNHLAHR